MMESDIVASIRTRYSKEKQSSTALSDQLRAKIQAQKKLAVKQSGDIMPFGTGETREQYERRIMETDEAWQDSGNLCEMLTGAQI